MIIDCDDCQVRGEACRDCVVTVVLGRTAGALEVTPVERDALAVLAGVGLVPRLRHLAAGA